MVDKLTLQLNFSSYGQGYSPNPHVSLSPGGVPLHPPHAPLPVRRPGSASSLHLYLCSLRNDGVQEGSETHGRRRRGGGRRGVRLVAAHRVQEDTGEPMGGAAPQVAVHGPRGMRRVYVFAFYWLCCVCRIACFYTPTGVKLKEEKL